MVKIPSMASKIIKVFTVIITLISLYALLGFYILPTVLTTQLPALIHSQTGRKASITRIAFNPFTFRCRLKGFSLQEKNGQPFVNFDRFDTKINLWQSYKQSALTIEEVLLTKPFIHIARQKNDNFNFADISKNKSEKKQSSGKIFPVSISKIAIIDGKLFWEDNHLDKGVQETISPLNLNIEHFTTNADHQSKLGVTLAETSGGKLEWKGKIGVNPIVSEGHITLNNIKLKTLLALALPSKPTFEIQGSERFTTDYTLGYSKDSLKLNLNNSKFELNDFQLFKKAPPSATINIPYLKLVGDYNIEQAKNNFRLKANNFKLAIQDFSLEEKNQESFLLKLLDITHEAKLAISYTDKKLHIIADKDNIDLRELVIEQRGSTNKTIKVPSINHQMDVVFDQTETSLQATINKAILGIRDVHIEDHNANNSTIDIPIINHETDIIVKQADKNLQITTNKSKLAIHDFHFEDRGDDKKIITIPSIDHELDIKFNQIDQDVHIITNKSILTIQKFRFEGQETDKKIISIPSITNSMDIKFNQTEKSKQLTANKAKLNMLNIEFKNNSNAKTEVKIPTFSHETDLNINIVDKIWQLAANKANVSSKNIQVSRLDPVHIMVNVPDIILETAYKADNTDNSFNVITDNGNFNIHKTQLTDVGHNAILATLNELSFAGIHVNLKNKELSLESVNAKRADFKAWLNADKTLNIQNLFPQPKQDTEPFNTKVTHKQDSAALWMIKINNVALNECGIDFEDRSLVKPVLMSARPIDFKLKNFSNKVGSQLPMQMSVGINKSGVIKLEGNTVLEPFTTQMSVKANNIALEKFQPYIDKFVRLDIIDGLFNISGNVAISKKINDTDIKFKGDTSVTELVTRDQIQNKDFVKWDKLSLNGIDADVVANRYSAETLTITKPYARVIIRKDKTINVKDILSVDKKNTVTEAKPLATGVTAQTSHRNDLHFKLNTVKIIDGASDFSDLSLILPFSAPIKGLNGGASGISSEQNSKITVTLQGNAFELSPVKIKGALSPYLGDFDVDMNFDGMPMPLVSPYMVQFAGYKVEKGKLSLGLKYKVEKKQLTATNSILIDQLELGDKVENPDAVSLPLELAVSLLKDSSGKIKIDVPLTGSLEDPKFSVGGLMADALMNVLTKIIAAPFNAIAGLVGSSEDLSVISFAAGTEALLPEQMLKLDDIAKVIKEKPALNIEIKGAAYQEQDWPALRKDALRDQLKRLKANEINKDNVKKIRAEYVELSDDEYNRLLADVFIEQFPKLAKKSLFGTPQLTNPEAGDFNSIAQKKMSESLQPDLKRLKELATERAEAIAKYLVQKAGIPNERIFILDTVVDPVRENKDIVSKLSLKTH